MTAVAVSMRDLRIEDPIKFRRRYEAWYANYFDYDWWDCVVDNFKEEMGPLGLSVDDVYFSLAYCQSDYASIKGRLDLHKWLTTAGYGESHLALTLDAKEYGAYWKVTTSGRGYSSDLNYINYEPGNTYPTGVFSDLPQDAWDELVREQYESEDWDKLAAEWVREQCRDLYSRLRDEYEYPSSEESFIGWSESNEI